MSPLLSVVMPVYNGAEYVQEAIISILNQTFTDFEFIIMDDRSTDKTVDIIKNIRDKRIRLFVNTTNLGRAGSDNAALKHIKGKYIAKMDSDDICLPDRFKEQINFLEQHPEVNIVGSWMQNFGASTYLNKYPADPDIARCTTLFGLPVGNPSIMLRTELFTQQGMLYDESLRQTEDFDFFARYADKLVVSSLPKALIKYRNYPDSYKRNILNERGEASHQVRRKFLDRWGIPYSEQEIAIHSAVAHTHLNHNTIRLVDVQDWLLKLYNYNKLNPFFNQIALQQELGLRWFHACYANPKKGLESNLAYYSSSLNNYYKLPISLQVKFLVKGLLNFI